MSVFRSYFSKNDTLIENNQTNNSQNPVTELSYGTVDAEVTRFIFDVDLNPLKQRIAEGVINPNRIKRHVLHMTNTVSTSDYNLGKKTNDGVTQRTSSFDLELFNLEEAWDEGSGYEFVYDEDKYVDRNVNFGGVANWFDRQTDIEWQVDGAYVPPTTGISGTSGSTILGSQHFEKGNEDIIIDLTDYINFKLGMNTGTTGMTGSTGIGIKFFDEYEVLETLYRQAVAFYARKTHTSFEPHIETIFDDTIEDDRNYFFLDKDNELYLYANAGGDPNAVTVNSVEIFDYMGQSVSVISGDSIENVSLGVYKIIVNVDSDGYPDAVLFTDSWNVTQNGKNKTIEQEFYLISQDNYFNFTLGNRINFDNYFFSYFGIAEGEKIKDNLIRRIELDVKQLYPNQDNNTALDVEYRLYNSQTDHHQFDIIPWTKVNRTFKGYEFLLDCSWLVPQDYTLEVKLVNGNVFKVKEPLNFTIVSDGITTPSDYNLPPLPTTTTTTTLPPTTTTTTTTLPPTTTTTTTTLPPTTTTTTTTIPPNPKVFMSLTPTFEPGTYTNRDTKIVSGDNMELLWTTDSTDTQNQGSIGTDLYESKVIQLNFLPIGQVSFETTNVVGVSGMTIDTGITGIYNVTLPAGFNEGWIQFTVRDTSGGVDDGAYTITASNNPDPTQVFGEVADSSDSEYVLKTTAGKAYGYDIISSTTILVDQLVSK